MRIVRATQDHIDTIKGQLRKSDHNDCWIACHKNANEVLQIAFNKSEVCWAVTLDDIPVACFGAVSITIISDKGMQWLLGTNDIYKIKPMKFVKQTKKYVKKMLEHFQSLENYVYHKNKKSLKWNNRCGFSIEDAVPYGVEKDLFCKVHIQREAQR